MQISFHGHACFSIKNGDNTLVTDPYDDSLGLKLPELKSTIVTVSRKHPHHNNSQAVQGEPKVFNWPGEYETAGIHLMGISSFHNAKDDKEQLENTIFKIKWNGINFCHLGSLGTKLTPEQTEAVGDIDILFVPVGGKEVIDAKKAKEVIEQIEPRVIIPMMFNTEGSTAGLDPLEPFLSEMGAQTTERLESFTLKRSELPDDSSKVVVLNQSYV